MLLGVDVFVNVIIHGQRSGPLERPFLLRHVSDGCLPAPQNHAHSCLMLQLTMSHVPRVMRYSKGSGKWKMAPC